MKTLLYTLLAVTLFLGTMTFASAQSDTNASNIASTNGDVNDSGVTQPQQESNATTTQSNNNTGSNNYQSNLTNATSNAGPDSTSIVITPNPFSITSGSVMQYTATVTDTSEQPTIPTGTVSWHEQVNTGEFQSDSCTLAPNNANSGESSCQVSYTTPDYCSCNLPATIIGSYQGDSSHQASSSSAHLTATFVAQNTVLEPNTIITQTGNIVVRFVSSFQKQLGQPQGIALDSSGNIYVANEYYDRVDKFDSKGNYISSIGSSGSAPGQVSSPYGIAIDKSGNVYVTDIDNVRVDKFDSSGNFVSDFGTRGNGDGQFFSLQGIAVDGSGNLYVADTVHPIQKFDSSGNFITTIGSDKTSSTMGVAVDNAGNIYATTANNNGFYILKFSNDGQIIAHWGSYCRMTDKLGCIDLDPSNPSSLGDGQFDDPDFIAIDKSGNIYVTDVGNNRIQVFDSSGHFLYKFGTFDEFPILFGNPNGIVVDNSGNIYVADQEDARVDILSVSNGNAVQQVIPQAIPPSTPSTIQSNTTITQPSTTIQSNTTITQPSTIPSSSLTTLPQPTSVFTPTQQDIQNINQAKASQTIAAEVNVGSNQSQTTSIDNNVSVQTTSSTPDSLNVNVSASSQTGPKVIAFNLNATTIDVANLKQLGVMYDGQLLQPAPNMDAILHAKSTDNPSFAIVVTQSGIQVLVLVPHFSTHSITIMNMSQIMTPTVPEFPFAILALMIGTFSIILIPKIIHR